MSDAPTLSEVLREAESTRFTDADISLRNSLYGIDGKGGLVERVNGEDLMTTFSTSPHYVIGWEDAMRTVRRALHAELGQVPKDE